MSSGKKVWFDDAMVKFFPEHCFGMWIEGKNKLNIDANLTRFHFDLDSLIFFITKKKREDQNQMTINLISKIKISHFL